MVNVVPAALSAAPELPERPALASGSFSGPATDQLRPAWRAWGRETILNQYFR